MDGISNICSRCSGKSKLTRCTCKSRPTVPEKCSGRSSPRRFQRLCSKRKDEETIEVIDISDDDGEDDDHGQGSFTEPYVEEITKQPSSSRYGYKSTEQPQYRYLRANCKPSCKSSLPQRSGEPAVERSKKPLLSEAVCNLANKSAPPPRFSEANRAKQPSSLKSACKPANEKSPPPTFSKLVDQRPKQPVHSKSTYKLASGSSHLPGSSNPAVKVRLKKPPCSPSPVNEARSVSRKSRITKEISPHGNGVKEGVHSKHKVEAFDELELEDIARVTLELFEGAKLLLRLRERKLGDINCLDLENRQEHEGGEFHNSPADKTPPSPSNEARAVCGKRPIGEEISPHGYCVKKRGHLKDEIKASDDESVSEAIEEITMEQFEKSKSLNESFRAEVRNKFMTLKNACNDMASTLRRMGINVDDIAKIST